MEAAVGAASGVGHLRRAEQTARHHLTEPGSIATASAPIEIVKLVSIDSLIADGKVPVPTIVKVDVEGHEEAALEGMAQTLRSAMPVVLVELDGSDETDVSRRVTTVLALLEPMGYRWTRLAGSYEHLEAPVAHFVFEVD